MKTLLATLALTMISNVAMANDFNLSKSGKVITCVDGNEASLKISADRKSMTVVIRDQNFGKLPITKVHTDNASYVAYDTKVGTMTLTDYSFFADKWQAYFTDCK